MKKLALGILFLAPAVGCLHLQPVGPLTTGSMGGKEAVTKPAPGVMVTPPQDAPAGPVVQTAPPPPLPALKVSPGEVSQSNYREVIRRLREELEDDRRTMEAMPKYSEVSVVKGSR